MSLTSIISVNYNQPQVTLDFLRSVAQNTERDSVEVILVDNGSFENFESIFKEVYPDLVYIRSEKNLGFAGGNNLGIREASGDYLLFLNNDTELVRGFVETLIDEFRKNPEIGLLSPLILYFDDKTRIQYAGFSAMNYLTCRNKGIGNQETNSNQHSRSQETGFIHGAAMMCRREDLQKVGLMEENYFLYYEELDWCEKFKKAGKKIWFTGRTKIYHKESISVGKESSLKTYFMHRNRMLFIRRNTSAINTLLFSIYYVFLACPKTMIKYYLNNRKDLIPWVIRALVWNLTNSIDSKALGYKALDRKRGRATELAN